MTMAIRELMAEVERVRDAFHRAVFVRPDLDAAMGQVGSGCALTDLPAGTGATGADEVRRHLAEDVLPHLPADLTFRRVSRTVDRWHLVEESTVAFTHDRELPWLLPGVAATHRRAEVLAISVVTVKKSRITAHRTLWDQVALAAQLAPSELASSPGRAGDGRPSPV